MPYERLVRAVVLVACVWFAFAAAWGFCEIPGGGHLGGGSAGAALLSLPIAQWHILYPSWDYFATSPPGPATYYCHHPFGVHYLSALALILFGKRDIVIHLPAILMSIAIPPLLFSLARKHWGLAGGAAAACAYVTVPLAVGYSNYHNLETICIFGALLFFWGLSHGHTTASLAGAIFACFGDWVGYLLIAPLLGWAFLRAFILPARWTPRADPHRYARWWACSVIIAVGTALLWMSLFYKADKLADWLGSAEMRGGGADLPLRSILENRKDWLDFSFTPFAIALGKIMAPVCILRALILRSDCEMYSPSILFAAVVQYVVFKRGADVHIFWPHYFAAYFALAMGPMAATLERAIRSVAPNRRTQWATLAFGLTPALAMAPDAVRSLPIWRATGGRYDDRGSGIRSEIDILAVERAVVLPRMSRDAVLDGHPSVGPSWEHLWTEQRIMNRASEPVFGAGGTTRHAMWFGRASGMSTDEQVRIAAAAPVEVYGDAWVVNEEAGHAPLEAWRVLEHEPNLLQWFLYGGWEPVRTIERKPDPLLTWEWRVHLGQQTELPVLGPSDSLDELRILHNAAVFSADRSRADDFSKRIFARLDRTVSTPFDQGLRLLGTRLTHGVRPCLEAWFEASGPTAGQATLIVRSAVEARARFSLIPAATTERDMGVLPPAISTKLWRSGFFYKVDVVLNHRIGRERYWAYWTAPDGAPPQRLDGRPTTDLATLP